MIILQLWMPRVSKFLVSRRSFHTFCTHFDGIIHMYPIAASMANNTQCRYVRKDGPATQLLNLPSQPNVVVECSQPHQRTPDTSSPPPVALFPISRPPSPRKTANPIAHVVSRRANDMCSQAAQAAKQTVSGFSLAMSFLNQ